MSDYSFIIGESEFKVAAQIEGDTAVVKTAQTEYRVLTIGDNLYQVTSNSHTRIIAAVKHKDTIYVDIDGAVIEVQPAASTQNSSLSAQHHHPVKDKIFAPMPGKIVKIMVNRGDTVTTRQPLVIVEAMKMENSIPSPVDGKVKAINFSVGDQVNTTSPIIELELISGQ